MSDLTPPAPAPLQTNLARRLAAGDETAVDELFDVYADGLYRSAYRYLYAADEAWDIVQDAFLRLWRRRLDLGQETDLRAYLFTIVRNRALDVLRRRRIEQRVLSVQSAAEERVITPDEGVSAAEQEITGVLRRAVQALPQRQRDVVLLRWHDRLTYDAIGRRLGISPRTAEAHMQRAVQRLRETLPEQLRSD